MARPKVKIDLVELEKLAGMQCTYEEIAAFFGVSTRTIERRCKNRKFLEAIERGKAKGRLSVRRALFRQAPTNIAAAIFLSKNLLGYKDVMSNEHSGPDGGPITIARPDFSDLSDEEIQQLRLLASKAKPPKGA
jgi:hypothetical protein